jgi:hypothetical protein
MPDETVKISAGVTGGLLAPASLLVAAAATVGFAFTPIAIAGPSHLFGYAFAIGAGVALMGIAMSILSLLDGRSAPKGTRRRSTAIGLGVVGIVLCSAAIATLFALWLWLPGAVAYTPFGSTTTQY